MKNVKVLLQLFVVYIAMIGITQPTLAISPLDGIAGGGSNPWLVINGKVTQLETSVLSIQQQIVLLTGRIDTLEGQVEANSSSITSLEVQNDELRTLINANISSINSIRTTISNLESELRATDAALSAKIDALTLCIEMLKAYLDEDGDGEFDLAARLENQIANNEWLIQVLQSQINDLRADIELKTAIENQQCPEGELVSGAEDGTLTCHIDNPGSSTHWVRKLSFTVPRTAVLANGYVIILGCGDGPSGDDTSISIVTGAGFSGKDDDTDIHDFYPRNFFDFRTINSYIFEFRRLALTTDSMSVYLMCMSSPELNGSDGYDD